jgi:hypothetical protein
MTIHILFHQDFYACDGGGNSSVRYRAGSDYPADDETMRLVAAGIAETVDIPDPAPSAKKSTAAAA